MNELVFMSFSSSVTTLNTQGTEDQHKINEDYRVLAGTITVYDADGAVLPNAAHDEITVTWTLESTNMNRRNTTLSAFALKDLLSNDNFMKTGILLKSGTNITFTAKHTSPATTVNNAVPIVTKLTLTLQKINTQI